MPESGSSVSPIATNTTTDQNSKSFERDSEFWFKGGDIIVVAQKTAFRFHKYVVSLHSSASPDIFSNPHPSESPVPDEAADKTCDGCPVVRVPDTSYDFRELLRAMYYGIRYPHPGQAATFPVLAMLARLSHKYKLDKNFAAVIYRLAHIFPTQLDVWDQCGGLNGHGPNRLSSADKIEAVNLFRLINTPNMLPTALYRCAQLEPDAISDGKTRVDGVTRELLSPSDRELCMKIKKELLPQATTRLLERLGEACRARLRVLQVNDNPDCPYPETCQEGLLTAMGACLQDLLKDVSTDPLDMRYISEVASLALDGKMCYVCGKVLETEYLQERRKIWMELPGLMGICIDANSWDSA